MYEPLAAHEHTVVAAFDFDGTLTKRDTLRLFFTEWCGWWGLCKVIFREAPRLLAGAILGGRHRDAARAAMTRRLLQGHAEEQVVEVAQRIVGRILDQELRPDTQAWLRWHLSCEHEVVIVSASFEAYVRPVAHSLGVHTVLATRWEVDGGLHLTGALDGPNVRGGEKARLLNRYLGGRQALVYAYGNSAGDRELLRAAEVQVWVSRRRRLTGPPLASTSEQQEEAASTGRKS
jgi:phosphatidylglycerophosphatase C